MLSFPRNYRSWSLDTVEPVCKVGIDVYHLSRGMSWKLVLELAESAENTSMSSLLVNRSLTASSPHRGQVKTVGSFFLTILTTRRLLLPNSNDSQPQRGWSQYLPLGERPNS